MILPSAPLQDDAIRMLATPRLASTPRRRLLTSCQNCRIQHLKCDSSTSTCHRCQKLGIQCIRNADIRFRYGSEQETGGELSFSEDQTWLELEAPLLYHDETSEIATYYTHEVDSERLISDNHPLNTRLEENATRDVIPQNSGSTLVADEVNLNSPTATAQSYSNIFMGNILSAQASPPSVLQGSPSSLDTFTGSGTPQTKADVPIVSLTDTEAILMRNFVDNMALWADVTDSRRHFEVDVPKRSLNNPLLRYAIFAFSSRHLHRGQDDDQAALHYHDKCLHELLPVVSGSPEKITDEVLATIAILRQYEEMEFQDNQFHLTGTTNILNSISRFSCSGGLGEAAAWLCLRQDIYVSLVFQQPLQIRLENFLASNAFRTDDDFCWAARMVFLLAKVLGHTFGDEPMLKSQQLQSIEVEINQWYASKPKSFNPIKYIPRSREQGRALPEIWLLSPCHVVGLQYYHIAKIVLGVSTRPSKSSQGYEDLRKVRKIEKIVRNHLCTVLGLARYNERAENTLFTARHTLCVWGGLLRSPLDRAAAIESLQHMESKTGWTTAPLVQSLKLQWDEDSDSD